MTDLQSEAREFLAREYKKAGDPVGAEWWLRAPSYQSANTTIAAMLAFRADGEAKARREALQECAAIADRLRNNSGACDIAKDIRALIDAPAKPET